MQKFEICGKVTTFSHNFLEMHQSFVLNKIQPMTLPTTTDPDSIQQLIHLKSTRLETVQNLRLLNV